MLSESKILALLKTGQKQSMTYGAVALLSEGENRFIEFLTKHGKPYSVWSPACEPVTNMVIPTLWNNGRDTDSTYIKFISPSTGKITFIYCGHCISMFTGDNNSEIQIVDYTDIKIKK